MLPIRLRVWFYESQQLIEDAQERLDVVEWLRVHNQGGRDVIRQRLRVMLCTNYVGRFGATVWQGDIVLTDRDPRPAVVLYDHKNARFSLKHADGTLHSLPQKLVKLGNAMEQRELLSLPNEGVVRDLVRVRATLAKAYDEGIAAKSVISFKENKLHIQIARRSLDGTAQGFNTTTTLNASQLNAWIADLLARRRRAGKPLSSILDETSA